MIYNAVIALFSSLLVTVQRSKQTTVCPQRWAVLLVLSTLWELSSVRPAGIYRKPCKLGLLWLVFVGVLGFVWARSRTVPALALCWCGVSSYAVRSVCLCVLCRLLCSPAWLAGSGALGSRALVRLCRLWVLVLGAFCAVSLNPSPLSGSGMCSALVFMLAVSFCESLTNSALSLVGALGWWLCACAYRLYFPRNGCLPSCVQPLGIPHPCKPCCGFFGFRVQWTTGGLYTTLAPLAVGAPCAILRRWQARHVSPPMSGAQF